MSEVVIDTNVLMTADGRAEHASAGCFGACVQELKRVRDECVVRLDDQRLILEEYRTSGLSFAGRPNVGSAFFKWLFDNQANPVHCRQVHVTPTADSDRGFEEFPDDPDLHGFHRDDRKFVAVALASTPRPPIMNATDTDWWRYRQALARHGLVITFLCPDLMGLQGC